MFDAKLFLVTGFWFLVSDFHKESFDRFNINASLGNSKHYLNRGITDNF